MLFCDGTKNYLDQKHKYNGKEFDNMYGLNTYDYGARQYNPVTARWDRMDPLCEKDYGTSPYVYCHDNPVNRIDPDGKADYFSTNGNFIKATEDKDPNIYIMSKGKPVLLSNYNFGENIKAMVRVTFHYAKEVGAATPECRIGVSTSKSNHVAVENGAQAFTSADKKGIYMICDGPQFQKTVNNKYSFMSTIIHEKTHTNLKVKGPEGEVKAIKAEMESPQFQKAPKEFKELTAGYLYNNFDNLQENLQKQYKQDVQKLLSPFDISL
jgi:RHS repeat-associated protein